MRSFAQLFDELDATTSLNAKVDAIARHLTGVAPVDAAWSVFFLAGARLKRLVAPARLRTWAIEHSGIPAWLVEDSYAAVGDLAETIALLFDCGEDPGASEGATLAQWVEERLEPLRGASEATQRAAVVGFWNELRGRTRELFVLHKILTGSLRVGVARGLVVRALAKIAGVPETTIAHRLMGEWRPSAGAFAALVAGEDAAAGADLARPYPFFLASPLDREPATLGPPEEWRAEWKWDGIRGQVVRRGGVTSIWSRGEELVTERFPELVEVFAALPDGTVLDGEILAWRDDAPLPFAILQKRIGRKQIGPKTLRDAPVAFLAYDLLEREGRDVRDQPFDVRRAWLETVVAGLQAEFSSARIGISPLVPFGDWGELTAARESARGRRTEGLMLKRADAAYETGRKRGAWWKWKIDPWSIDAVMVYAQAGHGRRSNLYTDYTLAVWQGDTLVPVARAYSGLTDAEIARLDRWIRGHTVQRFGPVRAVEPVQVFEIAFEGIQRSPRHKAGIALRFPRIARWREDKPAAEADSLETVEELLRAAEAVT